MIALIKNIQEKSLILAHYNNSEDKLLKLSKEIENKIVNGFVERMTLPNAKMAFMSTLLGLRDSESITKKLQMITVPTLIIWGENDPIIPIEYAQSFISGINDCRFYKMTECGHTPYVENPKAFYQVVSDFLN